MQLISTALSRGYHLKILKLKKNSPHIFFGLGLAGFVGTTVLASKATLKLPETLDEIEDQMASINATTEKEHKREVARVYVKAVGSLAKLYGPSVAVGGLSVAALTGSHVTLTRRNAALGAAYAAVSKALGDYRQRVQDELGVEKELDIYHSAHTRVLKNEEGKNENVKVFNSNNFSPYAKVFDAGNPNHVKNAELNRLFLTANQNYWNQRLQVRGHVFLNEVYESLGFDHTAAVSVVGWYIGKGGGDGFIDFGMFDGTEASNDFINGWERDIILDFNVDGSIYNLLQE